MPLGTFNLASRYMGGGGAGAVIPVSKRYQAIVTGTRSSTTTGFIGTAINQSSSGTYFNVVLGSGYKIGGGSAGTLEFYMKFASLSAQGSVFTLSNTSELVFLSNTGNGPRLRLSQNTSVAEYWEASLSTNTWYHFAITTSGNNTWKLWRDGSLMTTFTYSGNITSYSFSTNSAGAAQYDEIRFSNIERYTTTFTRPSSAFTNDSNTLALFHCESTSETDDGTGADGWLIPPAKASAATWTAGSGTWTIASGASALGGALNGSGVRSGWITVNPTDSTFYFLNSKPWTIEMRIWYPGTFGAFENIIGLGTVVGTDIYIRPKDGPVRFTYYANGENNDPDSGGANQSFTSPRHLAIVSDGLGNVKYFLDGILKASGTFTTSSSVRRFTIGSGGAVANRIDELRVSNTALYSSNFTVPTIPYTNNSSSTTLAYFPFHSDTTDAS